MNEIKQEIIKKSIKKNETPIVKCNYDLVNTFKEDSEKKLLHIQKFKNNEYSLSLKQFCFDPSKSSPPNEFIEKLLERISNYEK
jgi:hypothetical protein